MAKTVNNVLGGLNKANKRDKKNRKFVKRIDKLVSRIEKQVTALHSVSQKLQILRGDMKDVAQKEKAA